MLSALINQPLSVSYWICAQQTYVQVCVWERFKVFTFINAKIHWTLHKYINNKQIKTKYKQVDSMDMRINSQIHHGNKMA